MWQVGIFVCIGWIISVCLHEFGHAMVAYWGGDTSVKDKGYLTLNPLKYTDPGLSLLFPILFLIIGGIALPGGVVYIDRSRLRNRWWDSAVSAAGPFVNLLVTFLLIVPFLFHWETWLNNQWFFPSLAFLIVLQIFAIIFNLLPLPPLDGYGIIRPWLSPQIQQFLSPLYKYGLWVVLGLLWFSPPISNALWIFIFKISLFFGVPIDRAIEGFDLFNSPINKFILISVLLLVLWLIKKNNYSHALSQNSLLDSSTNSYQNITQVSDTIPNDWYQELWQLENNQQYHEALEMYDKKLQENPQDYIVWYHRGFLLERLKSYQEALICYEKSLLLSSNIYQSLNSIKIANLDKIRNINSSFYQVWYQRGEVLRKLQYYEEAIKSYDKVLEICPDDCNTWFVRGIAFYKNQSYQKALDSYEKALDLEPNISILWLFRGHVLINLSNYQEAIISYQKVLQLNPEQVEAWYNLAYCLYQLKQYKNAIKAYEKVINLQPDCANAWYNQACCYALQNQFKLALQCLEKAIALDPIKLKNYSKTDPDLQSLYLA